MKKNKITSTYLILAGAILIVGIVLPTVEAQELYDPAYNSSTTAQGSPRSALDDQSVLLIGDSQVAGQPGAALGNHITAAGATRYVRAGQSGWSIRRWYNNRRLMDDLISRHNPTLLVLILGGNDAARAHSASFDLLVASFWSAAQNSVESHAPEGTETSICWIAPPAAVGDNRHELQPLRALVSQRIQNVIGQNHFVRSEDLTNTRFGRSSDGIHFTFVGANNWMRHTIPRLETCVERQHPNSR